MNTWDKSELTIITLLLKLEDEADKEYFINSLYDIYVNNVQNYTSWMLIGVGTALIITFILLWVLM